MSVRVRPGTALIVAAAATAAVVATVSPITATAQSPNDQPLETAARAAQQVPFTGVLSVRWTDGPTPREERLEVEGANGSVVVHGGTPSRRDPNAVAVMASSEQRFVAHGGGPWNLLWPSAGPGVARPPTGSKYQLTDGAPVVVVNRPARVVEARHKGALVERLFLDVETGLLLRREHFEGAGPPDRTVEFESVTIGGAPPPLTVPPQAVDHASEVVSQGVPSGVSAPAALAEGYARVGLYRTAGVVQVQYNDGLFDLSIFEQEGRLDRGDLPDGERVRIGRAAGWHYEWAGGHVLVWERSGTVYTAVSDAPLDHIVDAVRSLPPAAASLSFMNRLRQVCRSLVQPFED
ncbi:MAG: hypothetical protein ACRD12_16710 [Acidimicrobiales bacterium]